MGCWPHVPLDAVVPDLDGTTVALCAVGRLGPVAAAVQAPALLVRLQDLADERRNSGRIDDGQLVRRTVLLPGPVAVRQWQSLRCGSRQRRGGRATLERGHTNPLVRQTGLEPLQRPLQQQLCLGNANVTA